eukprot:scaffold24136_cov131-Isochrysis_galbana.AAC.5
MARSTRASHCMQRSASAALGLLVTPRVARPGPSREAAAGSVAALPYECELESLTRPPPPPAESHTHKTIGGRVAQPSDTRGGRRRAAARPSHAYRAAAAD